MKTFSQFRAELDEMARSLGFPYSRMDASKDYRNRTFNETKHLPKHNYQLDNDNISIHVKSSPEVDHIFTNDNKNGESLHRCLIRHYESDENIPFHHDKQDEVDRIKDETRLPRGHAKNLIYDYMKNSNKPLVSSSTQYNTGHKMWKDLVKRAMDDSVHVYYHDGTKIHKTNKDNMNDHLEDYFGGTKDYENKHMILSNKEL